MDDFEEMLEAVCDAVGQTTIPSQPAPKPQPHSKQKKTDHKYIPPKSPPKTYDRSRRVISTFQSGIQKESFSYNQFRQSRQLINQAKLEHGNIHTNAKDFKYIDKLYPKEAAEAILLNTTRYWPGFNLDDILEGMLLEWLQDRPDIQQYVHDLTTAIEDLKCMDGVYLRLNLNTIAMPSSDRITIKTAFGSVVREKQPRKSAFTGSVRERMRQFLMSKGKYTANINTVYQGLEGIGKAYSFEQTLLSWMGYIVLRAIAERSKQSLLSNNKLL